jgi:hypothetical protein
MTTDSEQRRNEVVFITFLPPAHLRAEILWA